MTDLIVLRELAGKATNYLECGGLFNPELMEHEKVSDMVIECRDALAAAADEITRLRAERAEAERRGIERAAEVADRSAEYYSAVENHQLELSRNDKTPDGPNLLREEAARCSIRVAQAKRVARAIRALKVEG